MCRFFIPLWIVVVIFLSDGLVGARVLRVKHVGKPELKRSYGA